MLLEMVTTLQLASEDMPVPLFLDTRATQTVALGLRAVSCVQRMAQSCAVFTKVYDQYISVV